MSLSMDRFYQSEYLYKKSIFSVFRRPRRIFNKLLGVVARSSLVHPKIRIAIYILMGVNFEDKNDVYIGANVYLDEMNPQLITIGKNVFVTEGAKVITHFYDTSQPSHKFTFGPVTIERDVFVGFNVLVVNSVRIGHGSVIAANTVITEDVPPNKIIAGAGFRLIGDRFGKK